MNKKAWGVKNDKWEEIVDPLFVPKGIPDESYGGDPRIGPRLEALSYTSSMRVIEGKKLTVEVYPSRDHH